MKRVTSPELAATGGLFSHAVAASGLCMTSGMLGMGADGGVVSGFEPQAELALRNALTALEAAGAGVADVVFVQVLLADIDDWPAFNGVWQRVFAPDAMPARMAYQVAALPLGARVEVQATAVTAS